MNAEPQTPSPEFDPAALVGKTFKSESGHLYKVTEFNPEKPFGFAGTKPAITAISPTGAMCVYPLDAFIADFKEKV